jgi:hypothetical protein
MLPRNPAFSLSGPKFRDDWLIDTKDSPSPGQYDPKGPRRLLPPWSLGEKSREGKAKAESPKLLFPVGAFLVKLDDTVTMDEARAYAASHPDLAHVVREIFELILATKPDSPIEALRDQFEDIKAQMDDQDGDDDPLAKLLADFQKMRQS